jgi:uncharacterized protein YciI
MPLYIVIGFDDEATSVATRDALRARHLEFVLGDHSAIQFVGPMRSEDDGTICGSVYVFEAPSVAHVQRWLDEEPYYRGGVYRDVVIRPFEVRKNELPHRDLPSGIEAR